MDYNKTWLNNRTKRIELIRKDADELDKIQRKINISYFCGTCVGTAGLFGCVLPAPLKKVLTTRSILGLAFLGVASNVCVSNFLYLKQQKLVIDVQRSLKDDRNESAKLDNKILGNTVPGVKFEMHVKKVEGRVSYPETLVFYTSSYYHFVQTSITGNTQSTNEYSKEIRQLAKQLEDEVGVIKRRSTEKNIPSKQHLVREDIEDIQ